MEPGKAIQIHHLDDDPTNHNPENLSVLCLDCHDQTQTQGGFGRKLTRPVVTKFRDEWIARVTARREEADRLVVERAISSRISTSQANRQESESPGIAENGDSLDFINSLPRLKAELLAKLQSEWESDVTANTVQASYDYIGALSAILSRLAGYYPKGHFCDRDPRQFFSAQIAARFAWHRSIAEPDGRGTGGTIVNQICCANVQEEVERMVEEMVLSISDYGHRLDWEAWKNEWKGRIEQ